MKKITYIILCAVLLIPIVMSPSRVLAESANLIINPSAETAANSQPSNWTTNSWGTNTPTFTYDSTGHTGSRALSVSVKDYVDGDAKWMADQAAVTAGQTYTYTDYSKSDVMTELDVAYTNAAGEMSFVYLQSIPASTTWQQTTSTFTVPAGIVSASVYHILYSNGSLQTDDFSLTTQSTTTPPTNPTDPPVPTEPTVPTPPAATNLITNGSFETANGTDPAAWQRGGWGDHNATMTYTSGDAHAGTHSASVNISTITSGDAKWYANPVNVTAGATYTYQDYYKSNVATRVVIAMTNATGVDSYTELAAAPSSSTWALYSGNFTVPSDIKTVTMYHILDKVGTLNIDDASLTTGATTPTEPTNPNPGTGSNSIANPSLETADGTKPAGWQSDKWGTNTAVFNYVQNDAHTGTSSAKVTLSNYTDGDAKWSFAPLTNLTPGSQYSFSAWYKTNTQAHMVAAYVDTAGVEQYLTLPNPLAGADAQTVWQQYKTTLNVPSNAVSMTVYFLISSNGWLQTDDFSVVPSTPIGFNAPMVSLTFDDGWSSIYTNGLPILQKYGFASTQYLISSKLNTPDYMTTAMAQSFQTSGHEIASHTVTHPDLTSLTGAQLTAELSNSQTTLRQLFGTNVANSFASPYGLYTTNTLTGIKQYYQSHRSTDVGFNTKDNFNPYNILVQDVNTDTTPAEVAAWVAKAKADKSWLVLVYHPVIDSTNPDDYAVSPAHLDEELANIKASGVDVKTISQALASIQSQLQ